VRRILSISLLLLFSLPLVLPLFAADAAAANLPAWCRKDGKHHCMMIRTGSQDGNGQRVVAVRERCPCFPTMQATSHIDFSSDAVRECVRAAIVSHPSGVAQTEARLSISFDRSRQKRGPPIHQS
jgi:hypothetical protein